MTFIGYWSFRLWMIVFVTSTTNPFIPGLIASHWIIPKVEKSDNSATVAGFVASDIYWWNNGAKCNHTCSSLPWYAVLSPWGFHFRLQTARQWISKELMQINWCVLNVSSGHYTWRVLPVILHSIHNSYGNEHPHSPGPVEICASHM